SAVIIFLSLGVNLNAAQDAQKVNSRISAATVYNDRATITRSIKTGIAKGPSTLLVEGLPGNILVHSLRVGGVSDRAIEIASVEARRVHTKELSSEKEAQLRHTIQDLRDQRKAYQDQIEALDLQKAFMQSLIQSQPKLLREEMEIGKLDPVTWQNAWSLLQSGSVDMFKARSAAVIAQREIDEELNLLNQQLAKLATGQRQTVDAYITIDAAQAGTATFTLEYQIPGAAWQPMYDARLNTENAKLRLDQLASVTQTTGEDWNNIKLTLSTHRPSVNANFDPLSPWLLNFYDHRYNAVLADGSVSQRSMAPLAAESEAYEVDAMQEMMAKSSEKKDKREQARMRMASIHSAAFSAEYRIPGLVSLVSERNARKFKIQDQEFATDLLVMVAPQRSSKAYLHAELNYQGEEPLLPGGVALYRDGAFVGNSHMQLLRPEEDMKLSFGLDDAVKVTHKAQAEKKGTTGLLDKRDFITRDYKTTVHNYHKQAIAVRILDRLPVAQHEDIKVVSSDNTSKPSVVDVDDNPGILAWDFELEAGNDKALNFGYTISYPKDKVLSMAQR
ncbi:MAG: mucoidy inhibitor MuiA family protein, partial [Gammaproteobacteria bacterium]|nr:mucoidy inhibitor MuiA family protein [Gammaproteobacteria bacterium]